MKIAPTRTCHVLAAATTLSTWVLMGAVERAEPADAPPRRVYPHLLNPKEHPDYDRRHVRPPTWETFDNRTRFTCLRGFQVKDDRIVDFEAELERFTRKHHLGDVIWPSYPILFAKNLDELARAVKRRELFLFDIWGYVPGSGPGGYWQQFTPPEGVFEMLETTLGERWLGMDVGEQDGRYVGGYAPQMIPTGAGRFEQYLNVQRHFERMCNDLGNRMCTLVSLNFGHYFLKEGVYTLIGAETAQALPNSQVYYAFIRGAGKQYGVPWFGNASIFNRWGWKVYGVKEKPGMGPGPTKGTSLALLKRLLYSHILYNCVFVGFENGWLLEDELTPIGRIQQSAKRWVAEHGQPGVMHTPIAVMVDFLSGWSFPRHLYTGNVYRVWGNLPYEPGDYLTDGVLDMLYPRYQDSSYFHDETGFLTATPYGDAADCLLSDVPVWLLRRYPLLIVAGELRGGAEIRDKLTAYVEDGGRLIITAGSLANLPGGLFGVEATREPRPIPPGRSVMLDGKAIKEDRPFELLPLRLLQPADVRGRCGKVLAVVEVRSGRGAMTVLASPFGVGAERAVTGPITNPIDKPLAKPFPLLNHVRATLDASMRSTTLFEVGQGLACVTCRRGEGEYTLGVFNSELRPRPFKIVSHCGPIASVQELPLDQSEKSAVGYMPKGFEKVPVGESDTSTIAGGDVRIFRVRISRDTTVPIPHEVPPARPRGRILPLRSIASIKQEVLARPTFFEHFDGVMVDWRYVHHRSVDAVRAEAGWLRRQGLGIVVDLSPGLNLYPDLRLLNNLQGDYEASMAVIDDVLAKMALLGAQDLVLALHRLPENNFTPKQSWASWEATLREVCRSATKQGVTVHLRLYPARPPSNVESALAFIDRVKAPNLRLAPSTAALSVDDAKRLEARLKERLGLWMVGAPADDVGGRRWTVHEPVAGSGESERLGKLMSIRPQTGVVLDVVYPSQDAEYLDARALERLPGR